jgi:hypothetical protein
MKKLLLTLSILLFFVVEISQGQVTLSAAEKAALKQQYSLPFLIPNWRQYSYYDLLEMYPVPVKEKKGIHLFRHEEEEEAANDNMLARWHWFWAPRVNATGAFPAPDANLKAIAALNNTAAKGASTKSATANWVNQVLPSPQGSWGVGRIDRVFIVDAAGLNIWAGSPSGGLWHTTDGGATWAIMNESLGAIGISGIAVNPNNSNEIYIATGDGEARQDQATIGVYKSTDGGVTWTATGLTYNSSAGFNLSRLIMDKTNTQRLFCATDGGLMRTVNGGTTWKSVCGGSARDVKINPANPAIVYCTTGAGIYRSIDTGATFTIVSGTGLPASGFARISIAVTPANPNIVYAVYANNSYSLLGVYKSSDAGQHWAVKATTPTSLIGTQGWYALPIAASPIDSNLVFVGGLQVYRSANGGVSWSKTNPNTVHVDDHDLQFTSNGTKLFLGCDGGIYQTTSSASSWNNLSHGILATQQYHLGVSQTNPNLFLYGAQDNDVNVWNNGNWDGQALNADGFEVAINPSNNTVMFGESQYGGLARSTNSGASFSDISGAISSTEQGLWDTPFMLDPTTPTTMYIGYTNLFKSTNSGTTWTKVSNWTSGNVSAFDVYKKNSKIIYALRGASLYTTSDAGTTWTSCVSAGMTGNKTSVVICPWDSTRIWVSVSGYAAGKKVWYSDNGGITFSNFSGSLPNVPVNSLYYQDSTQDGLYACTEIGVWAYDTLVHDWVPFNQGMPPVTCTEVEYNRSANAVFCSTYGRGAWKSVAYPFVKHNYSTIPDNVGIREIKAISFECYPIPFHDLLHIRPSDSSNETVFSIFDNAGKCVYKGVITRPETVNDLSQLSSGQYYLQIGNEVKPITKD